MAKGKKRIVILGSTGSVGRQSIEVIESLGPDYQLVGVSGHSRWETIAQTTARLFDRLANQERI